MKVRHTLLPFVLVTVCTLLVLNGCGNPLANTQWEYKIVPVAQFFSQVNNGDTYAAESYLNSLGELGWECNTSFTLTSLLCKRPLIIEKLKW